MTSRVKKPTASYVAYQQSLKYKPNDIIFNDKVPLDQPVPQPPAKKPRQPRQPKQQPPPPPPNPLKYKPSEIFADKIQPIVT